MGTTGHHLAAGRRIVVAGADGPGAGIVGALVAAGAQVVVLGTGAETVGGARVIECGFTSSDEVSVAVAAAVKVLGGVDQFVYSWFPAALTGMATFAEIDEVEWAETCEGTLDAAWWWSQQAIGPLRASGGGSVVFMVPTLGMTGASGFSMLSVVAEGLRVLAKGCGRCWGSDGVTVNTVATSPALWVSPEYGGRMLRETSLSVPALGQVGDPGEDLAPLVELLGAGEAHFLTAGTLVADGGLWMGL